MEQDATAIANQLVDANLFDITGPIRVNYSASSFQGGPRVSYKDADLDLDFQDDEITRIQTPQGELVTVTLDNVADAFTRTFTLVVPSIRLPEARRSRSPRSGSRQPTVRARSSPPRARPGCSRLSGLPAPGHRPARRVSLVRPVRWPVRNLRFCGQQPLPRHRAVDGVQTRVRNQRRTAMTRQQTPRRASPVRGDTGAAPSRKEQ